MSKNRHTWLTVPEAFRLNTACNAVSRAEDAGDFPHPYLVGSVLERADYHDVDLRLVLTDEQFDRRFPDTRLLLFTNAVISDWLAKATGLPIDFQFQPWTECQEYSGRPRLPQGMDIR